MGRFTLKGLIILLFAINARSYQIAVPLNYAGYQPYPRILKMSNALAFQSLARLGSKPKFF
jgi:hypothetical protein